MASPSPAAAAASSRAAAADAIDLTLDGDSPTVTSTSAQCVNTRLDDHDDSIVLPQAAAAAAAAAAHANSQLAIPIELAASIAQEYTHGTNMTFQPYSPFGGFYSPFGQPPPPPPPQMPPAAPTFTQWHPLNGPTDTFYPPYQYHAATSAAAAAAASSAYLPYMFPPQDPFYQTYPQLPAHLVHTQTADSLPPPMPPAPPPAPVQSAPSINRKHARPHGHSSSRASSVAAPASSSSLTNSLSALPLPFMNVPDSPGRQPKSVQPVRPPSPKGPVVGSHDHPISILSDDDAPSDSDASTPDSSPLPTAQHTLVKDAAAATTHRRVPHVVADVESMMRARQAHSKASAVPAHQPPRESQARRVSEQPPASSPADHPDTPLPPLEPATPTPATAASSPEAPTHGFQMTLEAVPESTPHSESPTHPPTQPQPLVREQRNTADSGVLIPHLANSTPDESSSRHTPLADIAPAVAVASVPARVSSTAPSRAAIAALSPESRLARQRDRRRDQDRERRLRKRMQREKEAAEREAAAAAGKTDREATPMGEPSGDASTEMHDVPSAAPASSPSPAPLLPMASTIRAPSPAPSEAASHASHDDASRRSSPPVTSLPPPRAVRTDADDAARLSTLPHEDEPTHMSDVESNASEDQPLDPSPPALRRADFHAYPATTAAQAQVVPTSSKPLHPWMIGAESYDVPDLTRDRIRWRDVDRYLNRFIPPTTTSVPLPHGDVLGLGITFDSSERVVVAAKQLPASIQREVRTTRAAFRTRMESLLPRRLAANRAAIRRHVHEMSLPCDSLAALPFSAVTRSRPRDMPRRLREAAAAAASAHSTHSSSDLTQPAVIEQVCGRDLTKAVIHPISLSVLNAPTILAASSAPEYPFFTPEVERDGPVPERTIYTSVRRNVMKADDKRLRFVPYFGDEEGETVDASMYLDPTEGAAAEEEEETDEKLERDACILAVCVKYGDSDQVMQLLAKTLNRTSEESLQYDRRRPATKRRQRKPKGKKRARHHSAEESAESSNDEEDANDSSSSSESSSSSPLFTPTSLRQRWHQLSQHSERRAAQQFERLERFGCDSVEGLATLDAFRQAERERRVRERSDAMSCEGQYDNEGESKRGSAPMSPLPAIVDDGEGGSADDEVDLFTHPSTAAGASKLNLLHSFETHFCRRCFVYDCRLHGQSQPRVHDRRMPNEVELKEVERLGVRGARLRQHHTPPKATPPRSPKTHAHHTPPGKPGIKVAPLSGSTARSLPEGPSTLPCGAHCFRLLEQPRTSAHLAPSVAEMTDVPPPCSEPRCSMSALSGSLLAGVPPPPRVVWSELEKMLLRKLVYVSCSPPNTGRGGSSNTGDSPLDSSAAASTSDLHSVHALPFCSLANALGTKTCAEVADFVRRASLDAPFLTLASRRAQEAARARAALATSEPDASEGGARGPRGKKRKRRFGTRAALALRLKAAFKRSLHKLPHAHVACDHPGLACDDEAADCPCVRQEQFCEKYCACGGGGGGGAGAGSGLNGGVCSNLFLGCTCSRSGARCHTRACPCFVANRECDPDLCRGCEIGLGKTTHEHAPTQQEETRDNEAATGTPSPSPSPPPSEMRPPSRTDESPVPGSESHSTAAAANAAPSSKSTRARHCLNAPLQSSLRHPLLLGESEIHGWGCFLAAPLGTGTDADASGGGGARALRKHELVTEYFGELISQEEADRRGRIYDRLNRSYLFNLNAEYVVDAARKGNKIKFANHSESPNCYSKVMMVAGTHRIGIYAQKAIKPGEELLFDYQHDHSGTAPLWFMEKHAAGSAEEAGAAARKSTTTANNSAAAAAARHTER